MTPEQSIEYCWGKLKEAVDKRDRKAVSKYASMLKYYEQKVTIKL